MIAIRNALIRLSVSWLLLLVALHERPVTSCLVDENGSAIRDLVAVLVANLT